MSRIDEIRAQHQFCDGESQCQVAYVLAERDAMIAAVRELHRPVPESISAMYPHPLCSCGKEYRNCPTIKALGVSSG